MIVSKNGTQMEFRSTLSDRVQRALHGHCVDVGKELGDHTLKKRERLYGQVGRLKVRRNEIECELPAKGR